MGSGRSAENGAQVFDIYSLGCTGGLCEVMGEVSGRRVND